MLFMQLAMAGYVCPVGIKHAAGEAAAVMSPADMSDARVADEVMPGCAQAAAQDGSSAHLCMAHCQVESQSLDKHELPAFQAAPPDPILSVVVLSIATSGQDNDFAQAATLTRATSPPISIRNCCFRT